MASQSTIGIIGAMDVEVALLKKQMQECGEVHTTAFSGMEFIEGVIGQTSVVVVKCGVGMVNAATCTQILIDRFGVGAVLNTGVAARSTRPLNRRCGCGDRCREPHHGRKQPGLRRGPNAGRRHARLPHE